MKNIIQTLRERGFIENLTDPSLEEKLLEGPALVYNGFDPTASSLHIGNFLPIQILTHFQRAGHRPIALVGGATGLIGDPGGKKDERALLSKEEVAANAEGIKGVLSKFLDFEGPHAAILVNNLDWMADFSFIDFIREVGKNIRITEMLARDSVKSRLDSGVGMSFTEFSYQLLQAYDFVHLFREHGCILQTGGSDQWGNITAGTDLIRRLCGEQAYGLVCPLLTTASGQKFGKSEGGAIWLTADRTSPYQFYQYWVRSEDADVVRYLKLFTFLPLEEIEELEKQVEENPGAREAQRRLAYEVTQYVHGKEAADAAVAAAQALFGGDLTGLDERTLEDVFSEVPSFTLDRSKFNEGYSLVDALVDGGLSQSKGEARRLIQGGGVYINNQRAEEVAATLGQEHLLSGKLVVLRSGKKKYSLGRLSS